MSDENENMNDDEFNRPRRMSSSVVTVEDMVFQNYLTKMTHADENARGKDADNKEDLKLRVAGNSSRLIGGSAEDFRRLETMQTEKMIVITGSRANVQPKKSAITAEEEDDSFRDGVDITTQNNNDTGNDEDQVDDNEDDEYHVDANGNVVLNDAFNYNDPGNENVPKSTRHKIKKNNTQNLRSRFAKPFKPMLLPTYSGPKNGRQRKNPGVKKGL